MTDKKFRKNKFPEVTVVKIKIFDIISVTKKRVKSKGVSLRIFLVLVFVFVFFCFFFLFFSFFFDTNRMQYKLFTVINNLQLAPTPTV